MPSPSRSDSRRAFFMAPDARNQIQGKSSAAVDPATARRMTALRGTAAPRGFLCPPGSTILAWPFPPMSHATRTPPLTSAPPNKDTPPRIAMQPEEIGQTIATAILERTARAGASAQRAGALAPAGRQPLDDPVRAGGGCTTTASSRSRPTAARSSPSPRSAEAHLPVRGHRRHRAIGRRHHRSPRRRRAVAGRPARRAQEADEGAREGQHARVRATRDRLPFTSWSPSPATRCWSTRNASCCCATAS